MIIGGAIAAVGMAGSVISGNKAKKAEKKARQQENLRMMAENREKQLQMIRETRITRAESVAAAVASGAEDSSASSGAVSSIGSQFAHDLAYITNDMFSAKMIDHYKRAQTKYQTQQSLYSNLFSVGTSIMSMAAQSRSKEAPLSANDDKSGDMSYNSYLRQQGQGASIR